ncbi:MAG: DUF503 domain-containing protein [Bacteroidota bacterium]
MVGCAEAELLLPSAFSLKDKRQVLRSVTERLRRRNLAVAEVAGQEQWNRAVLAIAAVGGEEGRIRRCLEEALRFIEMDGRCEVMTACVEVY